MKKLLTTLILVTAALSAYCQCFTMVAGKDVSANGCVILAHNEDDSTDQPTKSSYVPAANGNLGYYWIEIAGLDVADSFINDNKVCVVSNRCQSKDKNMEEGGLLYEIRLTIAQKAKTAKEAVEIAGALVEQYGYKHNGRTYTIADENEAWVMSLVGGKHWLAQRIPDDKVFIIPNNFVLSTFDLSDTDNFLGSKDLVEYAVSQGWYNPADGKEFSFKEVFGDAKTYVSDRNVLRHRMAIEHFTGKPYSKNPDDYELFVTPYRKVSKEDMFSLLKADPICVRTTRYSVVFEVNENVPETWLCYIKPDLGTFIKIGQ